MFSDTELTVFCRATLDVCEPEPTQLREAAWAVLSTSCLARTNDLHSAKMSNFTVLVAHATTGKSRVSFTHERHNCPTYDKTIICHIEKELYVQILKAYIRQFDGIQADLSFWSKPSGNTANGTRHIPISRMELSHIASSIAQKMGIVGYRSYKQMAFRHLGFTRLTRMHLCDELIMRITNSTTSPNGVVEAGSRSSARLAYGPIILLLN
jgi:hypothetical protein